MKKKTKRLLAFSALLVVIGLGTLVGPSHFFDWFTNPKGALKEAQVTIGKVVSGDSEPVNILLIGNNARDAKNALSLGTAAGQADILIVAHIDPNTHKVTLISIPRDTLIAMPGWNEPIPKIKSTFELGLQQSPDEGPKLAMQYVSQLTGLKIDSYIATYFQGFSDAVDAVGGIQINIPARLYDPEHSGADFQPGLQTLNGQQALAYIRIRQNAAGNSYRTNDFQRQNAELEVLNTLKTKLLTSGTSLSEIQKLQAAWKKDIATNLSDSQLLGLGLEASGFSVEQIAIGSVADSMDLADAPISGINQEGELTGAYYDVLNPVEIELKLKPFGSVGASTGLPPMPAPSSVTVNVYGPQSLVDQLKTAGYQVQWMGPNQGSGQIEIYYPQDRLMSACSIARTLGTANELVAPAHSAAAVTVYGP